MSKRILFILGFILLAIAIWLQVTRIESVGRVIVRLQNLAYDMQLRTKLFPQKKNIETSVAIVDIDDKSLGKEGRWPWPRGKIADLIDHIQQNGAVVVAFDVLFPEKQNNIAEDVLFKLNQEKLTTPEITSSITKIAPYFADDNKLATSLKTIDSVLGISFTPRPDVSGILGTPVMTLTTPQEKKFAFINAPGVIGNIPILQEAAKGAGFINVFPDEDGSIRRVPILIRYQDKLYPSLALEAVRLFLLSHIRLVAANYSGELRIEAVKIGDEFIPTDAKGQVIVPFRGKSFTFPYYSATDVLHNNIPPSALQGKIIFIGTSATGQGDLKATAIQNIFPGVEIQATIADGILTKNFSYKPAWGLGVEVSLTILFGFIFIFLFPYLGPRLLATFIIGIPLFLIFVNNFLWNKTGLIISVFIPMIFVVTLAMINIVYGFLFETRKRERLKEMFGQYVPEKHIDEMLTHAGEYSFYGDDREMTVLFADIRNFTSISEPLDATQLKNLLSEFFTPMTQIIFNYRGTIDKYGGDMIMAFWGAPLVDKNHAKHAISAALDMINEVEKLKPIFKAKNWAEINIGIGLNTGNMSVGDMGSKFRRNYTVLGDAVNLASRIEGLTKFYGVKLMVTETTKAGQENFVFRQVDRVRVKGKKNGVEIYEVLCRKKELTENLTKELDLYHAALNHYFNQQWDKAHVIFAELQAAHPDVKLYSLYLRRVEEFKLTPPPSDWDGIYTHATK
jgi:adenylate cyclase